MAGGLQRRDLARLTGVHPETIRYYEQIGLLPSVPRRSNGYRIYDAQHVRRIRFVARARELGFSLAEIRTLLALADGSESRDCAHVQAITRRHLALVRERIRDLERIAAVLAAHLSRCAQAAEAPSCPFLETLFTAEGTAQAASPLQDRKDAQPCP
ncbi:MAG: MerR family transcriptional regulator [Alphaproteobacteria bacterium]|nr:MAG: MerR family transcriptional regulator [Alphaproteobacteria bacterium]